MLKQKDHLLFCYQICNISFLCVLFSYIRRGESHWWMKGSTPPQIAEIIIKLVKDMAAVSSRRFLPIHSFKAAPLVLYV